MHIHYNIQVEKLCSQIGLGKTINKPQLLKGGFLHRMFATQTKTGKYAVKALNPSIMKRPLATMNFMISEQIAQLVSQHTHTLPAKTFHGETILLLEGQYYLVFDWVPHQSLKKDSIRTKHCQKMGETLARIHNTDFSSIKIDPEILDTEQYVDWNDYLQQGIQKKMVWAPALEKCTHDLYKWNKQLIASATLLPPDTISHRDLDPKNILWDQDEPILIDWEAAGWINSSLDILETALYWAENEDENIDQHKLLTFIHSYNQALPTTTDWKIAIQKIPSNKLKWLEYNLKLSLEIEACSVEEKERGNDQVIQSLRDLKQYKKTAHMLEHCLEKTLSKQTSLADI